MKNILLSKFLMMPLLFGNTPILEYTSGSCSVIRNCLLVSKIVTKEDDCQPNSKLFEKLQLFIYLKYQLFSRPVVPLSYVAWDVMEHDICCQLTFRNHIRNSSTNCRLCETCYIANVM